MLAQLNDHGRMKAVKSETKMKSYLERKLIEFVHPGSQQTLRSSPLQQSYDSNSHLDVLLPSSD